MPVSSVSSASAPPAVLTYDNFPAHSTLSREILIDDRTGETCVKITAAATEAGPETRRTVARSAAISAAVTTFVALGVCALPFTALAWRQRHLLPWWTVLVFAVFCAALFALVWRSAIATRLAATEKFLKLNTVLVACPTRLLIECSGPHQPYSHEFARAAIRGVDVARSLESEKDTPCLLHGLRIALADGTHLNVLRGRSREELAWVAGMIGQVIGVGRK
jgi:hypothetical protein